MNDNDIREFVEISKRADRICAAEYADWIVAYRLVFCDAIAGRVQALAPHFDWYDPDTTYEEDTRAFCAALAEYAQEVGKALPTEEASGGMLKLFLVTQTEETGYGSYKSFVVACESVAQAIRTHPDQGDVWVHKVREEDGAFLQACKPFCSAAMAEDFDSDYIAKWATNISRVRAALIGTAEPGVKAGILCINQRSE